VGGYVCPLTGRALRLGVVVVPDQVILIRGIRSKNLIR